MRIIYYALILLSVHFSWVYSYEVEAKVTAYCPGRQSDGSFLKEKTKGGSPTNSYGAASANNIIPIGSTVTLPELGSFLVDDACGAARVYYKNTGRIQIDLRLSDYKAAMTWGIKYITIRIDPK